MLESVFSPSNRVFPDEKKIYLQKDRIHPVDKLYTRLCKHSFALHCLRAEFSLVTSSHPPNSSEPRTGLMESRFGNKSFLR